MTFVLLSMAALAIDLGFARFAQRQMQTAADAAALEGLRYRDAATPNADATRRRQAAEIVSLAFDDNLDPGDGDSQQFGAGGAIEFSGSVGDPSLTADQYMPPGGAAFFKPLLQTNEANSQEGDMAAGSYSDSGGPAVEDASYARSDFRLPDGSPGKTSDSSPSFLVRLRRTLNSQNPEAYDLDDVSGISSAGPTIPFLFGRGSLLARSSANASDLTIVSGITVRATAIADARPALSAGVTDAEHEIPGVAPFAVTAEYWSKLNNPSAAGADLAVVAANGDISSTLVSGEAGVVGSAPTAAMTIGQTYAPSGGDSALQVSPTWYAYLPLYASVGGVQRAIVGFGYVRWSQPDSAHLSLQAPWDNARNEPSPRVAVRNASAAIVVSPAFSGDAGFAQQVFGEHATLTAPLLAPALVNY